MFITTFHSFAAFFSRTAFAKWAHHHLQLQLQCCWLSQNNRVDLNLKSLLLLLSILPKWILFCHDGMRVREWRNINEQSRNLQNAQWHMPTPMDTAATLFFWFSFVFWFWLCRMKPKNNNKPLLTNHGWNRMPPTNETCLQFCATNKINNDQKKKCHYAKIDYVCVHTVNSRTKWNCVRFVGGVGGQKQSAFCMLNIKNRLIFCTAPNGYRITFLQTALQQR